MTAPSLFPAPRDVAAYDPTVASRASVHAAPERSLPPEGYELSVDAGSVRLGYADEAGRRYGEVTIAQLRRDDGSLPSIQIRDWPDVALRGFMLDISRDRVPTRATLERLVDVLATARFNHLQLYIEHTFAFPGHEQVWRDASPMTGDDMAWLDRRCAEAGIELAVNQNCFGHMERWLQHDAYRLMAECPEGVQFGSGRPSRPSVLAPTDDNARFVVELVREQLRHVQSRRVNIGCDETFELGLGVSAPDVAERGKGVVYVDHLRRIIRPLVEDGCSLQFWGDIVRSHPELLGELFGGWPPGALTAVAWTYEAPNGASVEVPPELAASLAAMGIDLESHRGFAHNAAPFAEAGIPFWLAPGTSSWNSLIGRLDNAKDNLLDAATNAISLGAQGVLVTDWGDNGHLQPISVSYPPIAYGGAVAWCAETNADLDVAVAVNAFIVDDPTGRTGDVLQEIGGLWRDTGMGTVNASPLQAALCPRQRHMVGGDPDRDLVAEVVVRLDAAADDLDAAAPDCVDGPMIVDELRTAVGLARHGAYRLLERAGGTAPSPGDLRRDLAGLIDRYRDDWSRRSRPGGLKDSVAQLERTLATYDIAADT